MTPAFSQSEYLTLLTHAPTEAVKALAETVLSTMGEIKILQSRTGLVMMPYKDSAQGALFHLGEVLVAEAHLALSDGTEGYGMVVGRDLEFAMGVAVLDAALTANIMTEQIETFLSEQKTIQENNDTELLRKVEATRVEMETF